MQADRLQDAAVRMRAFLVRWLASTIASIGKRHGLPMESPMQRGLGKIKQRIQDALKEKTDKMEETAHKDQLD